jgi:Carboxypeptidase regulatory-like domain
MKDLRLKNLICKSLGFFTVLSFLFLGTWLFTNTAYAQTNISGDIVGSVTDSTGAAVPNAQVTVTSAATAQAKTVTTSSNGQYRVPLLPPGSYKVSITASGFDTTDFTVTVSAGTPTSGDAKLTVGQSTTTINVTAEVSLLHTDDAQVSTTFDMQQVQTLPNPGNDLTFVAQTSPGAVMNTQGGYGNFAVFGLPATSNTFTVNGGYENDPFLNLNNSGATNLLLGNNDISDVTVVSNAYDSAFGGLGGAQVNEISRSGSNKFHGNASYWWNGRVMNANNWFNNNAPSGEKTDRPFDNVNQWAAAVGGPVFKDKTFFFVNYEGLRVVLPTRGTVYAPSPAYEAAVLNSTPICAASDPTCANPNPLVPNGNLAYNGNLAEVPQYQAIFNQYNSNPGYAGASLTSDPTAVLFNGTAGNFTHEYLVSGRVDQVLGVNDHLFGHFEVDKGVQATFTSLLNPIFNAASPQPQYQGQLNETHTFSPNITNQFLFATIYYRAIFTNTNQAAANQIAPFTLVWLGGNLGNNGVAGLVGGANYDWPQGRNVTGYQFADDVSFNRGVHTIKAGWAFRRDDVTDYDPSVRAVTPENYTTSAAFGAGYATRFRQSFPQSPTQPVALYGEGFYVQDQWKIRPNFTLTYGMRFEHNSNPICRNNCFSNLTDNFLSVASPTSTDTPYNKQINSGLHQAFYDFQTIALEPRVGFAWLPFGPDSRTTVRAGFGMFADTFPGVIADLMLTNPPTGVPFYIRGKYLLDSAQPGSGSEAVVAANKAFQAAYGGGGTFNTISAAVPGFVAPAFTSADRSIKYPTYEEFSLAVEQQLTKTTVLSVTYVGNHGYHEPVSNDNINAYGFPGLPDAAPNASLGQASEINSGAGSNYNGLITSIVDRRKWVQFQLNYTYSHALDEISNGGLDPFGLNSVAPNNPYDVHQNYGNADYDERNYISANYIITVPHFGGPKVLTDGWQVSGTVFHSTGLPFSVIDSATPANYGGGSIFADQLAYGIGSHCGGAKNAGLNGATTECSFATPGNSSAGFANFDYASGFNVQRRNQFTGSGYTDTDLSLTKGFGIPHWESANLRLGAQFFNVLNHPNFAQPVNDVESGSGQGGFGTINGTVNTPTSILGSFLGGDASPRLIQLKATFSF